MHRAVTKGLRPRAHLWSLDGWSAGLWRDYLRLIDDLLHGPHLGETVRDKLVRRSRVGEELPAWGDVAVVATELTEGFD